MVIKNERIIVRILLTARFSCDRRVSLNIDNRFDFRSPGGMRILQVYHLTVPGVEDLPPSLPGYIDDRVHLKC